MSIWSRLNLCVPWFRRRVRVADLDRELRNHMDLEAEEQREAGASPEEATYAALRALGNATQIKEDVRMAWGFQWLETLLQDIRYGLRQLRRNPGFTAIALITLALGIGATTAIFSIVNGVLLNPLPYPHAPRLMAFAEKLPPFQDFAISYPDFLDWVKMNHTFEALAAYRHTDMNLTGSGEAERVKVTQVSASFFPLLGVKPVIGRNFAPAEDRRGAASVVILS